MNISSKRGSQINPLPTTRMQDKCASLIAEGKDVIDLSIGDTDFRAPDLFATEVEESLKKGLTHYTRPVGIRELREAIAEYHSTKSEEVLVTAGGKEGVCSLFLAFVNPADEVVVPEPAWPAFRAYTALCGARYVPLPTSIEKEFEPSIEDLTSVLTKKTKMVVLNSPNNPTGSVYSSRLIQEAAQLAEKKGFVLVSDEIYSNYDYSGYFKSAKVLN